MSEQNALNPYEHRNTWFANLKRRPRTVADPGYNHSNDWKPTPTHSFMSRALRESSESLLPVAKNLIHAVPYLVRVLENESGKGLASPPDMKSILAAYVNMHNGITVDWNKNNFTGLTRGSPILTLELPPTVTAMITPLFYDLTLAPPSDYTANRGNDASAACDLIDNGQEPYASDVIMCTTAETYTAGEAIDGKQCVTAITSDPMIQACCNCCPAQCYANVTATATETAVLRLGYYTDAESARILLDHGAHYVVGADWGVDATHEHFVQRYHTRPTNDTSQPSVVDETRKLLLGAMHHHKTAWASGRFPEIALYDYDRSYSVCEG
eukprot:gene789-1263_t